MSHKKEKTMPKAIADPFTVRLKDLANPLVFIAEKEDVKPAEIIRRALRNYLEESKNLDHEILKSLSDSLEKFRQDFSRTGGNLNQIAWFMNSRDELDKDFLKAVHEDLRAEFRQLAQILKSLQKYLGR